MEVWICFSTPFNTNGLLSKINITICIEFITTWAEFQPMLVHPISSLKMYIGKISRVPRIETTRSHNMSLKSKAIKAIAKPRLASKIGVIGIFYVRLKTIFLISTISAVLYV